MEKFVLRFLRILSIILIGSIVLLAILVPAILIMQYTEPPLGFILMFFYVAIILSLFIVIFKYYMPDE